MIFWMARIARHMRAELHAKLDGAIAAGPAAVFVVAMLAVGREGLETALFLWAARRPPADDGSRRWSARCSASPPPSLVGWAFYRGALQAQPARCSSPGPACSSSSSPAGVLAYGVHDLQEAGHPARASTTSPSTSPRRSRRRACSGPCSRASSTSRRPRRGSRPIAWVAYVVPTMFLFVRAGLGPPAARARRRRRRRRPSAPRPPDRLPRTHRRRQHPLQETRCPAAPPPVAARPRSPPRSSSLPARSPAASPTRPAPAASGRSTSSRPRPSASCPRPGRPPARSRSRSRTRATTSPSSTCSARTGCGSFRGRERRPGPHPRPRRAGRPGHVLHGVQARAWSATGSGPSSP